MTSGVRRVGIAMAGNAVSPLASFASAPLLTRVLGVGDRGDVASATSLLFLATAVATFGLPQAVTWYAARDTRAMLPSLRRVLLGLTFIGLGATVFLIVVAPVVATSAQVVHGMQFAALAVIPTLVVAALQAAAAGLHAWHLVTAERAITATVRLIALIGAASIGHLDVISATIILAASPLAGAIAYCRLARTADTVRAVTNSPQLPVPTQFLVPVAVRSRQLVRYGLAAWVGSLSGVLLARLDQAVIAPLAGAEALGLYVVAVSVSELPLIFTNAIRDVSFTSSSQNGDFQKLATTARATNVVSLAIGTTVAGSALWWLPALFGESFAPALPATIVLVGAVVVGNPGSLAGVGLAASGRPGLRSVSLAIAAAVNLACLILLAPALGALGAALATLAGNLVASNINIVLLARISGIRGTSFYGFGGREVFHSLRHAWDRLSKN